MTLSNKELEIVAAWVLEMLATYRPDQLDSSEKELMLTILEEVTNQ